MKRRVAILGSTGSIGKQALEVISGHPEMFEVVTLTANTNAQLLIKRGLALIFRKRSFITHRSGTDS